MFSLFEPEARKVRDLAELEILQTRFGDGYIKELEQRAKDKSLDKKNRSHWRRLYRKAKSL